MVEGPAGDWWMVYHGYENGFRTLGRQTLLDPVEWTADGWLRAKGGDLSRPLAKPGGGKASVSGYALSGGFSAERLGVQWCFHQPGPKEMQRAVFNNGTLRLAAAGASPTDSSPLTCIVGERAYQAEVTLELEDEGAEGGILLFYNHKAYVGLGFTADTVKTYQYSEELPWARNPRATRKVRVRLTNDSNIITYEYSHDDGRSWTLHGTRMEVSGIHHNVFGGFLSLRVGLYSTGAGAVKFSDFSYRAIKETSGK